MNTLGEFIFKLPVRISREEQAAITGHTKEKGFVSPMNVDGERYYIWKSNLYRHLDYAALEPQIQEKFKKEKRSADFLLRNRLDLPWVWADGGAADTVKAICARLEPYVRQITRVQSLLLRPGANIPLHTDLIAGESYDGQVYDPFNDGSFVTNELHKKNDYLTIKIPLSDDYLNNGYPFISQGEERYLYDPEDHAFAIDEYRVRHGALGVGHWRGVLLVDGYFNVAKMREARIAMDLRPHRYQRIFRRVMTIQRKSLDQPFVGHDDARPDIRAVVADYSAMRMRSPHFLGAAFSYADGGRTFIKHEFWDTEKNYSDFYFANRAFVDSMVVMYTAEAERRGIETKRIGHEVLFSELSARERECLEKRRFLSAAPLKDVSI